MEYIVLKKDLYKLADGTLWEGNINNVPKGNASLIGKAGKEYKKDYLEFHGWSAEEKKAPAKKKSVKKEVVDKAVKPEDIEDK